MAPKCPAPKGPELMHGYTPLIGLEAWLSTMGKRRIFSASTSVFYALPHPHICTSTFYHCSLFWLCCCCYLVMNRKLALEIFEAVSTASTNENSAQLIFQFQIVSTCRPLLRKTCRPGCP